MSTPYDVGIWLACQVAGRDERLTDGEALMWAGRAAQPIDKIEIDPNKGSDGALVIHFHDMGRIVIADNGRSCCEQRYLTCDDDLPSFTGARIVEIDLAAAAPAGRVVHPDDEWGDVHEEHFLKIRTTNGDFTVVSHNEHNGYYGGISPAITWEDA